MTDSMLRRYFGRPPKGWTVESIGDCVTEVAQPIQMNDSTLYRLVSIRRRNGGMFHRADLYGKEILTKDLQRVIPGAFVIARRQIVHGACALASADFAGAALSSSYSQFLGTGICDIRYLAWLARHPLMYSYFMDASRGIVIEKLNFDVSRWLSYSINLPPLSEQRRIVEVLDHYDEILSQTRRLLEKHDAIVESTRNAVFRDLNSQWRTFDLASAGTWFSGGTPSTSVAKYWGGSVPWISASSLKNMDIWDSDRRVTEDGMANGTRVAPENSVLFVVRGMSLKSEFRVGVARRAVAFGQDCRAITLRPNLSPSFVAHALKAKTHEILAMVEEASHGTGRLETKRLGRLSLSAPPTMAEQERVADLVDESRRARDCVHAELDKLHAVQVGLMDDLLTGRVQVKSGV